MYVHKQIYTILRHLSFRLVSTPRLPRCAFNVWYQILGLCFNPYKFDETTYSFRFVVKTFRLFHVHFFIQNAIEKRRPNVGLSQDHLIFKRPRQKNAKKTLVSRWSKRLVIMEAFNLSTTFADKSAFVSIDFPKLISLGLVNPFAPNKLASWR